MKKNNNIALHENRYVKKNIRQNKLVHSVSQNVEKHCFMYTQRAEKIYFDLVCFIVLKSKKS